MSDSEFSAAQGQYPQTLRTSENEGLLSAIVNQTTVGVAVIDLEGRFKFVNECFSRLVGRSREELLQLSFADITHADDLPGNLEMFERARNGQGNFEIEKRYVRPDGTQVWVLNNVTFLRDGAGVPYAVMAVTLDISDRKRAEARQASVARHAAMRAEVSAAFNEGGSLRAVLQSCAESVVRHLDAALARIWTLDADGVQGDRCYHDLSSIPGGVGAVVIATHLRAVSGLVRELKHSSGVLNPSRFMGRALSLRAVALDRCAVVLHERFPCRLERPARDDARPSGRGRGAS